MQLNPDFDSNQMAATYAFKSFRADIWAMNNEFHFVVMLHGRTADQVETYLHTVYPLINTIYVYEIEED